MKTITESDGDFICEINIPCFQTLGPDEIRLVRESRTQVIFRKGDMLSKQGAFASYVLFILKGLVKQYIEGEGQRNFNLGIIKPGEFIGLSAVFLKNLFACSSVALTDCQVYLVEKDAIADLAIGNGKFGFGLIKRYCSQNADLVGILKNMNFRQMNGRMAELLLYLNGIRQEYPDVFQLLTRKDIAEFAGISTESAVKLLKNFEKDGLVKLNEKDIELTDLPGIIEISKRG